MTRVQSCEKERDSLNNYLSRLAALCLVIGCMSTVCLGITITTHCLLCTASNYSVSDETKEDTLTQNHTKICRGKWSKEPGLFSKFLGVSESVCGICNIRPLTTVGCGTVGCGQYVLCDYAVPGVWRVLCHASLGTGNGARENYTCGQF